VSVSEIDKAKANELSRQIIGAAIDVHRHLGPGLLESAYQACLCRELELRGIPFQPQIYMPLEYKWVLVEKAYRLDFLVAGSVVVELKALERLDPIHEAQLLTYLRLSER
jgi:GxxExxY protein